MDYGKLIYQQRDTPPKQHTLRLGSTTLGRDAGNDLVLDADGISRYHARIICTPTDCTITDLESTNGTLVNGVPAQPDEPMQLMNGNIIQLGYVWARYCAPL